MLRRFFLRVVLLLFILVFISACSVLEPKQPQEFDTTDQVKRIVREPLSPEQTGELVEEVGGNWLYGQGLGETAFTVGSIVLFPPAAIWHLGNAVVSLSGYKPIGVSYLLSDEDEQGWNNVYDGVMSGPGRVIAGVSGKEYRSKEVIRENMKKYYVPAEKNFAAQRPRERSS